MNIFNNDAPIIVQVRQPGEYQTNTFYTPMYIMDEVPPEDAPVELLKDGRRDDEFYGWQREHGGVIGQEQIFRVVLRGRDERPVIVNGITAEVVNHSQPRRRRMVHPSEGLRRRPRA